VAVLSYKYRIEPNRAQATALGDMLADFCQLYNAGLEQRIAAYRREWGSENAIKSAKTCSLLCNKLRARGTAAVELTASLASVGVRCPALCHVDYGHKIDSLTLLSR
jgi:hypothetical protein